jgi:hypothetical protein
MCGSAGLLNKKCFLRALVVYRIMEIVDFSGFVVLPGSDSSIGLTLPALDSGAGGNNSVDSEAECGDNNVSS